MFYLLQAQQNDLQQSIEELECQLEKAKAVHKQEILQLSREHEEKILLFLRQMAATDKVN